MVRVLHATESHRIVIFFLLPGLRSAPLKIYLRGIASNFAPIWSHLFFCPFPVEFHHSVPDTATTILVSKLLMSLRTTSQVIRCSFVSSSVSNVIYCLPGVQGYVGYSPGNSTTILAFRGSSNIQNWIVDFSFPLVQFDGLPPGAKVEASYAIS
jgi:hypothetical protein